MTRDWHAIQRTFENDILIHCKDSCGRISAVLTSIEHHMHYMLRNPLKILIWRIKCMMLHMSKTILCALASPTNKQRCTASRFNPDCLVLPWSWLIWIVIDRSMCACLQTQLIVVNSSPRSWILVEGTGLVLFFNANAHAIAHAIANAQDAQSYNVRWNPANKGLLWRVPETLFAVPPSQSFIVLSVFRASWACGRVLKLLCRFSLPWTSRLLTQFQRKNWAGTTQQYSCISHAVMMRGEYYGMCVTATRWCPDNLR